MSLLLSETGASATRRGERQKNKKRNTFGGLMLVNQDCISVRCGGATKSRGALFLLAINLLGLSCVVLSQPIPSFSARKISQFETEEFKVKAYSFLQEEKNNQLLCN